MRTYKYAQILAGTDAKSWAVHDCARTDHSMGVSWDG